MPRSRRSLAGAGWAMAYRCIEAPRDVEIVREEIADREPRKDIPAA